MGTQQGRIPDKDRQTEAFGGKSIKHRTKPQSTHDIPSLPSHERARAHSGQPE